MGNFVLGFVEKQRLNGTADKEILLKLLGAGWPADIAIKALEYHSSEKKKGAKQAFIPRSKIYRLSTSFRSLL